MTLAAEGSPSAAPAPPSPVAPGRRIESLDVARGFALLGIFLVNVEFFALPAGAALEIAAPAESGLSLALWWLVDALCEGKFYPLFSLLFGIGLALQRESVQSRGAEFAPLAVRRLGFLASLGLLHGLFLWYGDILFVYAVTGLLVCLLLRTSWRVLLGVGVAALALGVMVATLAGALIGAYPAPPPADHEHAGHAPRMEGPPLATVFQLLRSTDAPGPEHPSWQAAETEAYARGPWLQAQGFRMLTFLLMMASMAAGGGLAILAMFLFGAAMVKLGLLAEHRAWLWRLALGGLGLGLPLSLFATWVGGFGHGAGTVAVAAACVSVGGPLLALGYLGACDLLTAAGPRFAPARVVAGWLAPAGRMALTNYLLQTVVATFVTYHWGLGRFGALERPERIGLVVAVFLAQLVVSRLWLARFRFGPMEWLWRSFTYASWQPMGRASVP